MFRGKFSKAQRVKSVEDIFEWCVLVVQEAAPLDHGVEATFCVSRLVYRLSFIGAASRRFLELGG